MIFEVEVLSINDFHCPSLPFRTLQRSTYSALDWVDSLLSSEPLDEEIRTQLNSIRNPILRTLKICGIYLSHAVRKLLGFSIRKNSRAEDDESSESSEGYEKQSVMDASVHSSVSEEEDEEEDFLQPNEGALAGLRYLWTQRKDEHAKAG